MFRRTRLPVPRQIGSLGTTLAKTLNKKGAAGDFFTENGEEVDDYLQEWSFPFPAQATFQTTGFHAENNHPGRRSVGHGFNRNLPDGVLWSRLQRPGL